MAASLGAARHHSSLEDSLQLMQLSRAATKSIITDSLARGSFTDKHTKEGYSAPDAMMAIAYTMSKIPPLSPRKSSPETEILPESCYWLFRAHSHFLRLSVIHASIPPQRCNSTICLYPEPVILRQSPQAPASRHSILRIRFPLKLIFRRRPQSVRL
ncbi:hypothetical protein L211DRAFT_476449 [Terfezia boudieri ATCC MYA-4762]|uniref:Uncharacterized protein n=1 Tax=Terfezia boudieri ATCC MYA-4762 TaxID=1051890 RepID=A0A3N4LYJ8_9PEZI|nr:hypothetical protein L211DRAFT_476449 [Terfezia boudieri ATCC MYA-4762]